MRLREEELDAHVLALFERMKTQDEKGILKLKDPASGKLAGPIISNGRGGRICTVLNYDYQPDSHAA
ncbi:MAG: hypothetical protein ACLQVA_19045 [Candidatus Brocadiia bacterium]